MAISPHPHVEMHTRDKSIYVPQNVQITPLHKPLYMLRARKGKPGVPVWCPTYMVAVDTFGADTFNPKSKYFSEHAYFLLKTFELGQGAWLMRCASDLATESQVFVEVAAVDVGVKQWKRNSVTGQFVLDDAGEKIPINDQGEECRVLAEDEEVNEYTISTDKKLVLEKLAAKKYAARVYVGYKYSPVTVLEKSALLFKGVGDPIAVKIDYDVADLADKSIAWYSWEESSSEEVVPAGTIKATYTKDDGTVGWLKCVRVTTTTKDQTLQYCTFKYASYAAELVKVEPNTKLDLVRNKVIAADGTEEDLEDPYTYVLYTRTPDATVTEDDGRGNQRAFSYVDNTVSAVDGTYEINGCTVEAGDVVKQNGDVFRDIDTLELTPYDGEYQDGVQYWYYLNNDDTTEPVALDGNSFDTETQYYTGETVTVNTFVGNIGSSLYIKTKELSGGNGDLEPQAVIPGVKLVWRATLRSAADERSREDDDVLEEGGINWYPMFNVKASNPGTWGQAFGFRFFYDKGANTIAGTMSNGAITYTIAPVEMREGESTPREVIDPYGQSSVTGVMKKGVVDAQTGVSLELSDVIPAHYYGSKELPCSFVFNNANWAKVGAIVMQKEIEGRAMAATIYPALREDGTDAEGNYVPGGGPLCIFVDDVLGLPPGGADTTTINELTADATPRFMANIVSAVGCDKIPYFATEVEKALDSSYGEDVVDLKESNAFYLKGGDDGDISDWAIEEYTRRYIDAMIAGTHEYLADYLRCDYNAIFDVGYSLETKKKLLEFMYYRDNLFVFLTAQSTMKYKETRVIKGEKVVVENLVPANLTQYEEETIGALLRTYALLMIDDIENNTGANRAAIFLSAGHNTDHKALHDRVPFTLWAALRYASYLNGTRITGAPIERPGSIVDCFEKVAWTAFVDESRSRIWNAGLCYPQYADRNQIQVAALRTVYRYDTSVLCDIGTAMATTFCKDIIRDEWTYWVNSDRDPEDLNSRIQERLEARTKYALNGRYQVKYNVYQNDEDKKLGYSRQVECDLTANPGNRVWKSTITLRKTGYDPDAES